jgi:hypothetical protein
MTLGDLLRKLREVGDQFNTYEVPLVDEKEGKVDFDLDTIKDADGKWCVQITRIWG